MGLMSEKGSIEISFPDKKYSPGETVSGTIKLNLAKPVKARALKVAFFGNYNLKYGFGKDSRKFRLVDNINGSGGNILDAFTVTKTISGSRSYQNGETLSFAIQIPGNIVGYPVYNYFLKAYLDLPAKMDILKISEIKIDLNKASDRWGRGRLYMTIIGTLALVGLALAGGSIQGAILFGLVGGLYALFIYFIGVKRK